MEPSRLSFLFESYLHQQASASEVDELMQLLEEPSNKARVNELMDTFISGKQESTRIDDKNAADILQAIFNASIQQDSSMAGHFTRRVHFLRTAWFRYAAVILLMLGVGSYLWFNNTTSDPINHTNPTHPNSDILPGSNRAILTLANGQRIILDSTQGNIVQQGRLTVVNASGRLNYEGLASGLEYHTLSTPKGGQYKLQLPDGTNVWLNAASSITYPTAFTGKDRTVTITGEAYFEVVTDKAKIFHVRTPKEEITVLGTHFNVNAYSDEGTTKTSLLEGAVKIGNFILKPGQAFVGGKITSTNIEQDIAWKNGIFSFNDADIPTVMRQLSRWYNLDIRYEGNLPQRKFKGELPRDLELPQVLKILNRIDVKFRIEGRTLIVTP